MNVNDVTCTPRQRALAAIHHQVPDRVPAYVRNVLDWERHAARFGVSTWEELAAYLGNTILSFTPTHRTIPSVTNTTALPTSLWGVPEDLFGTYTDSVPRPLAHAETPADVDAFAWPSPSPTEWDFAGLRTLLLNETTCARLGPSWMPVFSELCELFGMEQAMVNLHWNRRVIEAAVAHLDEFYTEFYRNLLDICGDQLDIFGLGDDFAGNSSLLIQPAMWRSMFKPLYAKWLGMAKAKGLPTLMHSCGVVVGVLPDLIDSGLDAWQTVQAHLPGQDAARLKAEFGKDLTFVGAIDTTNILGRCGPAEIQEHVRRQILTLGEGGGYICAPDHTIMAEVPSENVTALYQTVAEFRAPGYTL